MKPINTLLTLLSLTTVAISLERASPTTRIFLQPDRILHLHEVVQIVFITAFSVVVTFLIFRTVTRNFQSLNSTAGIILACVFMLGSYFFATGNAAHEVASFLFGAYCDTRSVHPGHCASAFFDDYFFGNIVYFIGLGLSTLAIILLEIRSPDESMTRGDSNVTMANGLVLALTFIAYDGFDRVAVGLVSTLTYAIIFTPLLIRSGRPYRSKPVTLYSSIGFVPASVVALPLRLL